MLRFGPGKERSAGTAKESHFSPSLNRCSADETATSMQGISVIVVRAMSQRHHSAFPDCDTGHVSLIKNSDFPRYTSSPSINPLKRLTLRSTAPSNTPARGSIKLNQCLARVIPV